MRTNTVSGPMERLVNGEKAKEERRLRIGGMYWIAVRQEGMKTAWRSQCNRWHICRTFGLMPWELYAGNIYKEKEYMRKLLNDSDNLHVLIEHSIRDGFLITSKALSCP